MACLSCYCIAQIDVLCITADVSMGIWLYLGLRAVGVGIGGVAPGPSSMLWIRVLLYWTTQTRLPRPSLWAMWSMDLIATTEPTCRGVWGCSRGALCWRTVEDGRTLPWISGVTYSVRFPCWLDLTGLRSLELYGRSRPREHVVYSQNTVQPMFFKQHLQSPWHSWFSKLSILCH